MTAPRPAKRPVGRPSDYEPRFIEDAYAYIDNHETKGDPVPTVEGLACEVGTSKKTLLAWTENHPEFLHAVDALRCKQGRLLQSMGLTGKSSPVITKLMLSANHGMREKSDVTTGDKPIQGVIVLPSTHADSLGSEPGAADGGSPQD